MSIEELLKPRVKIIAPWPGMKYFSVGDILTLNEFVGMYTKPTAVGVYIDEAEKCTANFRKLEWWEERTPDEMPKYVKLVPIGDDGIKVKPGQILKVKKILPLSRTFVFDGYIELGFERSLPATEAEYNEYSQQKQST